MSAASGGGPLARLWSTALSGLVDIGFVKVYLRDSVGDFVVREDALLLTLGYEALDLF